MGAKGPDAMNATGGGNSVDSKQLCITLLNALERAVTCSNDFLEGDELELVEVTCPETRKSGHHASKRVLAAITAIGARYAITASGSDTDSSHSGSDNSLTPRDIVFDRVLETTEEALEQFNSSLDSARGIKDAVVVQPGAIGPECRIAALTGKTLKRQGTFVEMEKPQTHFPDYPTDNSDAPFVPSFGSRSGANNVNKFQDEQDGDIEVGLYLQNLFKTNSKPNVGGAAGRRHPYEEEIKAAAAEMSQIEFKEEDTSVYRPLESTPCTFIITEEELFNMAERLKQVTEVAVDIENHSVRSFQGFTCLLQISTRREDFVIDALALRGSIHRALAPVFADESTVKVLHGADRDVQWLERDFGIYVVNMFDTGQAARLLKFPSAALSFLQARFCALTGTSKKKFQLADWRQRPLPDDMYEYARSDTHYLLYIYDRLRAELAKKDLTSKAWERSAIVSRKRHVKIRYDPGMPRHICAKYGLGFDQHQIRLLEELCQWRDRRAREEDESLNYVTPLGTLFGIVRARDKARTVQGLMKHGFPSRPVPPLIKANAEEIVRLISDSLDAKLEDAAKQCVDMSKSDNPSEEKTAMDDDHNNAAIESATEHTCLDKNESMKKNGDARKVRQLACAKASARPKPSLFELDSSDSDSDEGGRQKAMNKGEIKPDMAAEMASIVERAEENLKSSDERIVPQAHLMVSKLKPKAADAAKSVFDLSDSDDGSEEDGHVRKSPVEQGMEDSLKPCGATDGSNMDPGSAQASSTSRANGELDVACLAALSSDRVMPKVRAARNSAFGLTGESEDSCDEDRGGQQQSSKLKQPESKEEVLARVRAGICELVPRVPAAFRVETDEVPVESAGKCMAEVKGTVESPSGKRKRDEDDEEGVPMSLQEKYGMKLGHGKKKKRKKKKRKREAEAVTEAVTEAAPEMPAFDYVKALREEKKQQDEARKLEKAFDPMQRLRLDWKDKDRGKKRPRKARKSPGSGVKSMSFRGR